MIESGADVVSVDWRIKLKEVRQYIASSNNKIAVQGNFDPSRLLSPPEEIKRMVTQMINEFGKDRYIVNLGHGILPNIPIENAKAFIDAVKEYKAQ